MQCTLRRHSDEAHPRSRWEHKSVPVPETSLPGSSPLARGTPLFIVLEEGSLRLIPARAGNTVKCQAPLVNFPAHPRSRGEHSTVFHAVTSAPGSSPLARGTLSVESRGSCAGRLIPARAGNTKSAMKNDDSVSAHPRSRGEHVIWRVRGARRAGSSPLARGTLWVVCKDSLGVRLIPARAGNTLSECRVPHAFPAHPRSRGEHCKVIRVELIEHGSSPLARGTPERN